MIEQRIVFRTVSALSFILSLSTLIHAQSVFTYQGYLRQSGVPANGNFDFEFQLTTAPVGGFLLGTDTELNVPVANGLFTVQLDFGDQFSGADRYIAIRVRPAGGGAYTTLAPRVLITRSPYAIRANIASNLQLPYTATLSNAASLFSLTNTGSGRAMTLSVDNAASAANTLQLNSNGNANSQVIYGVHTGLGDAALFQINNAANAGEALEGRTNGTGDAVFGFNNGTGRAGVFQISNSANNAYALYGLTNGGGPAIVGYNTGTGQAGVFQIANASNADSALYATTNGTGNAIYAIHTGSSNNAVDLRITNANNTASAVYAHTVGRGNAGAFIINNTANTGDGLNVSLNGTGNGLYIVHSGTANNGAEIRTTGATNTASTVLAVNEGRGVAGYFEVNNAANANSAVVATTNGTGNALYAVHTGASNNAVDLRISNAANASNALYAVTNGGGNTIFAENTGTSNNAGDFRIANANNAAAALYCSTTGTGPALWANGTARVDVLEISGADLAEKFPTSETLKPGMVAEIDPKNTGKLRLSRSAYNKRVAGVVSGANNLPAGAILGQHLPGVEQGHAIALSGRVWVYCDATEKAIEAGDLLTTAKRTGYAMAVRDPKKAHGAIIGKAMSGLKKGKTGMVLVLVNLH